MKTKKSSIKIYNLINEIIFFIFLGALSHPSTKASNFHDKTKISKELNKNKLNLINENKKSSINSAKTEKKNKLLGNERTVDDYNGQEITGEQLTLYIYNAVTSEGFQNSKFIGCTLNDGETHLFVVRKAFTFNNIEFSFPNTGIGAIKIECPDKVTIRNCKFTGCSVSNGLGNCIYVMQTSNKATTSSDFIYEFTDLTITQTQSNGFAIYIDNNPQSFLVQDNTFTSGSGGGINLINTEKVEILGCTFSKNSNGRAFVINCNSNVDQITFENNTFKEHVTDTGGFGGNINADRGSIALTFLDCKFIDNEQRTNGGGFNCHDNLINHKITFTGCTFTNNKANGNGGAICLNSQQESTITDCTFNGNTANSNEGGAIYINNPKVTISKCIFSQNKASRGQALFVANANAQIIIDQDTSFTSDMNEEVTDLQYMIVLKNTDTELTNVQFRCQLVNGKQSYPVLFDSTTNPFDWQSINH